MIITRKDYSRAVGVCIETAARRLKAVPSQCGDRRACVYELRAALPTLWPKEVEAGAVERLVAAAAPPEDRLYVGPDALEGARSFIQWLPAQEMRDRLAEIQSDFISGIAASPVCGGPVIRDLENLRTLIAIQPDSMKYILVGGQVPTLDRLAPAFAIINAKFQMELVA
ncbi:hypothetical protein [Citreimonas salinaria]|uniref:Uncharacterized protein n=1 Tax=Citreimonas salinaria TaxID=321339 RepID=A0A1H3LKW2_9RHOB|nr:hypothetical protein [Citreimonas salinaria]SDY65041.1 hypothetical protein SAMN05444340_11373 [Citreimonas salinaria]